MNTTHPESVRTTSLRRALLASLIATLAAGFAAPAFAGSGEWANDQLLHCQATVGDNQVDWKLELDDSVGLASVDDAEVPAEYTATHVRVRLSADGPALFFGRSTGRLLITAADGQTIGAGVCSPVTATAVTSYPHAATCPSMRKDSSTPKAEPLPSGIRI